MFGSYCPYARYVKRAIIQNLANTKRRINGNHSPRHLPEPMHIPHNDLSDAEAICKGTLNPKPPHLQKTFTLIPVTCSFCPCRGSHFCSTHRSPLGWPPLQRSLAFAWYSLVQGFAFVVAVRGVLGTGRSNSRSSKKRRATRDPCQDIVHFWMAPVPATAAAGVVPRQGPTK